MPPLESTDLSLPFIEVGDTVRLKTPYKPLVVNSAVEAAMRQLIFEDPDIQTRADRPADIPLDAYHRDRTAQQYLKFTHATVVEVLGHHSQGAVDTGTAQEVLPETPEPDNWPVRNVSHMFDIDLERELRDRGIREVTKSEKQDALLRFAAEQPEAIADLIESERRGE